MAVKERSNKKFVCYDYEGFFNGGIVDISHWVCYVINNNIVDTRVVSLKDTQRSVDEGNKSTQVKTPLDERNLAKEISNGEINIVSFDGKFRTVPISVAVNIQSCVLSITFDKNHIVDMNRIERAMKLGRL